MIWIFLWVPSTWTVWGDSGGSAQRETWAIDHRLCCSCLFSNTALLLTSAAPVLPRLTVCSVGPEGDAAAHIWTFYSIITIWWCRVLLETSWFWPDVGPAEVVPFQNLTVGHWDQVAAVLSSLLSFLRFASQQPRCLLAGLVLGQ